MNFLVTDIIQIVVYIAILIAAYWAFRIEFVKHKEHTRLKIIELEKGYIELKQAVFMCEKHSEERMEKIHALLQNQYQKFHSENAKEHKEIMQSLEEIKIKIASEYAKKG